MSFPKRTPEGKEKRRVWDREYKARLRKENMFGYRVKQLYYQSKARARNKNLEHSITVEDIISIWPPDNKCPVYGFILEWNSSGFRGTSPSIDRIDNSMGYTKDNIQIISFRANEIKMNATIEELEKLVMFLKAGN